MGSAIQAVSVVRKGTEDAVEVPWESLCVADIASGDCVPVAGVTRDPSRSSEVGDLFSLLTANDPCWTTRLNAAKDLAKQGEEGIRALAVGLEWSDAEPRLKPRMSVNELEREMRRVCEGVSSSCRQALEELKDSDPRCAGILLQYEARRLQKAAAQNA